VRDGEYGSWPSSAVIVLLRPNARKTKRENTSEALPRIRISMATPETP
jgi:hypothetical protein